MWDFECGPDPRAVKAAHPPDEPAEWWELVRQEHADRRMRLSRLAKQEDIEPPQFFDACVRNVNVGATSTEIPILRVVFPDRVFFDTDQDVIRPEAYRILDIVAESLSREPPDVTLFVAGHTDSTGPEDYNHNLSIRRAEGVARALVVRGVGESQVWRVGFGETMPIRSNATESGRGANRRVEFLFAALPQAIVQWIKTQQVDACYFAETPGARDCRRLVPKQKEVLAVRVANHEKSTQVTTPHSSSVEVARSEAAIASERHSRQVAVAPTAKPVAVRVPPVELIRIRLPDPVASVGASRR